MKGEGVKNPRTIRNIKDARAHGYTLEFFGDTEELHLTRLRDVSGVVVLLNSDYLPGQAKAGKGPWRLDVRFKGKLDFKNAKAE